jgi:cytochrome b subunit of formate dehydrogenase
MQTELERFTLAERRLHWLNALAILLLAGTGAVIWRDWDKWRIAHVNVISQGHVWLGGGLLVATLLGFAFFRRRRVLQCKQRFNPGQRLNLLAFQVLIPFMIASGVVINWSRALGLDKHARGLVKEAHLLSAGAIALLVLAHLAMVFLVPKNRGILAAMLTGRIPRDVIARVAPQWLSALDTPANPPEAPQPVSRQAG